MNTAEDKESKKGKKVKVEEGEKKVKVAEEE